MNKYICIKDCKLTINNHTKYFKKGQEVDENLYTERFNKKFKKIGELSCISHLTKIIYEEVREPKINKKKKRNKNKKVFDNKKEFIEK